MDDQEQKKQAERIAGYLKTLDLEKFNIVEVRIGKRQDQVSYSLEIHCKDGPGFIMISMQLSEAL